ncbi:MAG: type II toxin-antitoxin system VapB family antitoxin [Acidobacteriia bacterium]|nr:type II toxin-antitoxin system VapB family antitoxin [Terriglobia bacterium]
MALNIKNPEVERLATEVAHLARETKTEAIRRALEERKARLAVRAKSTSEERVREITEYFKREVWPLIPPDVRGKTITKEEQEEILGIGPNGYPE